MDILNCDNCNIQFTKRSANVKYERKKGQKTFFCSRECRCLYIKKKQVTLNCYFCEKEFKKDEKAHNRGLRKERNKFYCSQRCANRDRKSSEKTKEKISIKLKEFYKNNDHHSKQKRIDKVCPICLTEFSVSNCYKHRIYCSKACCNSDTEYLYKNKANTGGYRKGSGRSIGGWYKGIYCDSTYELVYLIYCMDHCIDIKRCEMMFEYGNEGKTYNPDFIVNNCIIEIKGYMTEEVKTKAKSVPKKYEYKILTKDKLLKEFDYVKRKYNKTSNKIKELYDDYKPTYEYKCSTCDVVFFTDRMRKTTSVFCSRKCCGKFKNKTKIVKR